MKRFISNIYFRYVFFMIGGIFLGWLFFHTPHHKSETNGQQKDSVSTTLWTCAMHPQINMPQPGKCPICGMDLIPKNQGQVGFDSAAVHLTKEAAQLASVMTSPVTRQKPVMEIRLYGKVQADERMLQSQVAHVPGRIEKLLVNFTGETVQKGQILALLYSPELITAQQELLEAAKIRQSQPDIYEAAKEKLRHWKLTELQIASIENSGIINNNLEIVSNTAGIVTARRVNFGDYVNQGTVLFEVADLSRVWVMFEAYENDLQFLQRGEHAEFTVQALPGIKFSANIEFIDPVIDPVTRVAKVRVEVSNQSGRLKPEMFVTGLVQAKLNEYKNNLVIPKSAVLWTGIRSIVYVKQPGTDDPVYSMREIGLGPLLGNSYVVTDGLREGEEIVTRGAFSVDAAAQLEGKPSMMNSNFKIEVDREVSLQLNTLFDQYLVLKDAFVQSDSKKTKQAAQLVQLSILNADGKLQTGDARKHWTDITGKLDNLIKQIVSSDDIDEQRKAFSGFSSELYGIIKIFGLIGRTVYYQFCPMAFNDKGAFWLSTTKEIRNPYFGNQMLTCGEIKETLYY